MEFDNHVDVGALIALVGLILTIIGAIVAQVWSWAKFKTHMDEQIKSVNARISKLESQSSKHSGCISTLKRDIPTQYIDKAEHDRMSESCRAHIFSAINAHESVIADLKDDVKALKDVAKNTEIIVTKILTKLEAMK